MPTSKEFMGNVRTQLAFVPDITYKMFYATYYIYYRNKYVAMVINNKIYVKDTPSAENMLTSAYLELPYAKAKFAMLRIERFESADYMTKVFEAMYEELPDQG